jgi:hypothetical protein
MVCLIVFAAHHIRDNIFYFPPIILAIIRAAHIQLFHWVRSHERTRFSHGWTNRFFQQNHLVCNDRCNERSKIKKVFNIFRKSSCIILICISISLFRYYRIFLFLNTCWIQLRRNIHPAPLRKSRLKSPLSKSAPSFMTSASQWENLPMTLYFLDPRVMTHTAV